MALVLGDSKDFGRQKWLTDNTKIKIITNLGIPKSWSTHRYLAKSKITFDETKANINFNGIRINGFM